MSKADEADTTSRRGFLRLGSLLSGGAAAGLLVPWAGGKVLSLAEPAKAADLAVKAGSFPMSPAFQTFREEALALEMIKREFSLNPRYGGYSASSTDCPHYRQAQAMRSVGYHVFERGAETWSDLADLAEIAYLFAPKEMNWTTKTAEQRMSMRSSYTGRLYRYDSETDRHRSSYGDVEIHANAALIEGVLRLTGRAGYDPCLAHDLWNVQRT